MPQADFGPKLRLLKIWLEKHLHSKKEKELKEKGFMQNQKPLGIKIVITT